MYQQAIESIQECVDFSLTMLNDPSTPDFMRPEWKAHAQEGMTAIDRLIADWAAADE
jgi:hypothetical protein